ncbi:hypothetical protein HYH02_002200 [Chlamydomonas schloesseri]|uniref:Uncharacterized protein n=1 Tax=Chlamydomonas schloesseri TaxID=2026947 RepID=A0A836BAP2_9CHLO|nr:hypothetical protein HYH02_002200 [Chlamydomonas schloesseri]|eukprot:KAG2452856.1 hypothetical protein HYH02_002200 [Chlamydomonas schloesseri]
MAAGGGHMDGPGHQVVSTAAPTVGTPKTPGGRRPQGTGAGGGLGHLRGPPAGARGLLQEEEEDGPGPAAVATAMAAEAAALRRKGATGLLESQDSFCT